jgi:polysaccharide export outer membrane protein
MSLLLAGCTALPTSGPSRLDITGGATSSITTDRHAIGFDYVLLDVSRDVLANVRELGPGAFFATFGTGRGPAPVIRVGVGDVVAVSVFESAAGGLFIPAEAGVRPGNFVTLPPQMVDRSGTISVPFAGHIKAAGLSLPEIQKEIETRLANRAIEPQAIVTLAEQNATEVSVVGEVAAGANRFRIRAGGDRVLDILSRAGGFRYPGYELFVTLQRGKRRATVYFPALVNAPSENIFVAPGDTIYVSREQQKFVALGAFGAGGQTSGLTNQFAFEQERLSLNEAVAKAGGLLDDRADPRQVFLYRLEYRDTLEMLQVDLSKFPREQKLIPTVYRLNYRDPSAFFLAQGFPMRHKDIIYVTNADSVEVVKFLDYISAITSTVAGVSVDAVTIRNPNQGLGNN